MAKGYKNTGTLIRIFFGQDYDLFGETIKEVLESYLETEKLNTATKVCQEVDDLLLLNESALTETFDAISQGEFSPDSWDETVRSFLAKIKSHLSEKPQLS